MRLTSNSHRKSVSSPCARLFSENPNHLRMISGNMKMKPAHARIRPNTREYGRTHPNTPEQTQIHPNTPEHAQKSIDDFLTIFCDFLRFLTISRLTSNSHRKSVSSPRARLFSENPNHLRMISGNMKMKPAHARIRPNTREYGRTHPNTPEQTQIHPNTPEHAQKSIDDFFTIFDDFRRFRDFL